MINEWHETQLQFHATQMTLLFIQHFVQRKIGKFPEMKQLCSKKNLTKAIFNYFDYNWKYQLPL